MREATKKSFSMNGVNRKTATSKTFNLFIVGKENRMKKRNSNLKYVFIIIPIVAVAIGIGAFAFPQEGKQEAISNNSALILGGSPIVGDPDAPLMFVEWGDYQCTYCYRFHTQTRDSVFSNFVDSGKIRFVFRDFPLNGPASVMAAEVSLS